jgi:hypothetical protein
MMSEDDNDQKNQVGAWVAMGVGADARQRK